ncbi:Rsf1 [Salpingoeca rosetta]|uniref:Rsf1 n=1 Tax=Salpingoeca rosetta (strain ATCC 50818 / BSB-021) TaxID=946362 RepID=F2UJQ0_SALR5|nr:Rsf1 [Salpingoeca rosetta]EGD77349.1 Rsf1 [Salpingoeca rosetta]|eukprot:XP_004990693.1 Rsf1 [Salpingoeca rosetta]
MAGRMRVYVGGLPDDADKRELEAEFSKFGRLQDVWVARKPPGFAFIEFENDMDARDAVRELDGRELCGNRVRVEIARGGRRGGGGGGAP